MPRTYLITGCSGFLGHHLAQFLVRAGHRVTGTYHRKEFSLEGVRAVPCNFQDRDSVRKVLDALTPDVIFHLAAQSLIQASWKDFEGTFQTNVFGTYYLLETLREKNWKGRLVIAGSSSEYGSIPANEAPLQEGGPFQPRNPYALSKIAEDLLGWVYFKSFGMPIIRVIPFYIMGPRKEPDAPSDFAKAIVRHRKGDPAPITVGNLNVVRDVVDVRDAVRALVLISEKGEEGTAYNLCTGKETTLQEILDRLLKIAGSEIPVHHDPAKFRVGEDQKIVGSASRLKSLGWEPAFSLNETLKTILDYWARSV